MTRRAGLLLSAGLALLTAGAALAQFVLVGLVGLLLVPLGFGLLVAAVVAVQPAAARSRRGIAAAAAFGAGVLTYAAFRAGALSFAVAIHRLQQGTFVERATGGAWLLSFALAVVGGALYIGALSHGAGWAPRARTRWFVAAVAVFPVTVALFFALAAWLPLSA